jgi:Fe2+ transport system protein FeoA
MADRYVICPLCGFEFERGDTLCVHGCPMRTHCSLIRCPSCDYEFPEKPRALTWFGRLFKRESSGLEECEGIRVVSDLAPGEISEVVSLGAEASRRKTLSAFGLVPGSQITVIQQRPACVVRVGETELALDREIAREILVLAEGATES